MFPRTGELQRLINCCIKVAQNGQRCQQAFAPRPAAERHRSKR
jgi:hypothetical protein